MKLFSSLKNKTVMTAKKLFAYSELQQGLRSQATILKDLVNSNLEKVKSEEENIVIPAVQVIAAQRNFKRLLAIFMALFFLGILYCIANLIRKDWILALLALAFCIMCLSFAFRYHFWLYQIKKRQLGVKFSEYYQDEIIHNHLDSDAKSKVNKVEK